MRRTPSRALVVAAALAALVLVTFWPVTRHEFVAFDDDLYVTRNPWVQRGLTAESVHWAFTNFGYSANWHPLTWLSHMADVELFGLDPGRHHAVNLALHAASTVVLFLLLLAASGALWRSALVAALFAVHPLHVESVAWVAERKDVLSAFLFFLAAAAHVRFARRPGAGRYALLLLLFALGLLAKPMIVTLPLVLLLLDWWPLGRPFGLAPGGAAAARTARVLRHPLGEKLPLLALAALASAVTFAAQRRGGTVTGIEVLRLPLRVANAANSCVVYLGQTLWPAKLAVFYPYPTHGWAALPPWRLALAALILLGATAAAFLLRRRIPALTAGWTWYLAMLAPVAGFVQVGTQARADRYTYLPLVGVFIAVAWALPAKPGRRAAFPAGAALAAVALCAVLARAQAGVWRDKITLFRHALEVTENNWVAHINLARAYQDAGRKGEAVAEYREVLRIVPQLSEGRVALSALLQELGRNEEAATVLQETARARPDLWQARLNLGIGLLNDGRTDEAIVSLREAVRLKPDSADARFNLGTALARKREFEEAAQQLEEGLRLEPADASAEYTLGLVCERLGRLAAAADHLAAALRLRPGDEAAREALRSVRARLNPDH